MATKPRAEPVWTELGPDLTQLDVPHKVTRYLCAAAYTDAGFRERVLERNRDEIHARAPEIGIDIGIVTRYCSRAQRSQRFRYPLICLPTFALAALVLANLDRPWDQDTILWMISCWAAAAIIVCLDLFSGDSVRRDLARAVFIKDVEGAADTDRERNVIVYSGFSPFVGAGLNLGGWSFAVDLARGKQDLAVHDPQPFSLRELYGHVEQTFQLLQIPHLGLSRKLFVNGKCVRAVRQILPDPHKRPIEHLPDEVVASYADNRSKELRHYLCVEMVDWGGELVVTLFIRFQKLSSKLFVEVSTSMLLPMKSSYYELDKLHSKQRFKDAAALISEAMLLGAVFLIWAPFGVWSSINRSIARARLSKHQRKEIDSDLLFDYGAKESVREFASGDEWRVYFQKLDKEMHHKMVQQQLLDCLVDFLDDHGIDTSEIKERTTHILNNGLIVSGGSVTAEGLAVGERAQTKVTGLLKRTRTKESV